MSLVGTRPPTVDEWDKYELHHRARLATKPGLTGMWQVSGRSNITDFEEVVKLDKQYISEWTIYTSGISLNNEGQAESIDLELVKELHKSGVDKIIFDLPAINETIYNKFMGTSGYQKFVFESIRKVQSEGIFSEIHFVPTKLNVEEIPKVMEFAEKEGINMVSFLGLVPHSPYLDFTSNQCHNSPMIIKRLKSSVLNF